MAGTVQERLRQLPERPPPLGSWAAIEQRLVAPRQRFLRAVGATTLAAGFAALALIGFRHLAPVPAPVSPTEQVVAEAEVAYSVPELQARARDLEAMLGSLPEGPQLRRADTGQDADSLRDRIDAVDARLRQLDAAAGQAPTSARLWHERVALLNELVKLRYQEIGLESF